MTNDAQEYDIATIRHLLLAAFTSEDLRHLCDDLPTFRPIVDRLGPGPVVVDKDEQKGKGTSWIRSRGTRRPP